MITMVEQEKQKQDCMDTDSLPDLPDDLIYVILLRCSVQSIFRFKCVCKTWDRYISNPSFREDYISIQKKSQVPQPLVGFFHFKITEIAIDHPGRMIFHSHHEEFAPRGFSFLPTSIELQGQPLIRFDRVNNRFGINTYSFKGISNGLLLLGDHPDFNVFNPITSKLFSLPRASDDIKSMNDNNNHILLRTACPGFFSSEFNNDFKVIVPYVISRAIEDNNLWVQIYSSKTRVWKVSNLVGARDFQVDTVVLPTSTGDGTLLWLFHNYNPMHFHRQGLMVYDIDRVDSDNDHVLLIELPRLGRTLRPPTLTKTSHGFLQCITDSSKFRGFRVFKLAKKLASYSYDDVVSVNEWISTHNVRLDIIVDAIWHNPNSRDKIQQFDRYVVRMGCHPLNPNLVIFRMGSEIFSYNLENGDLNRIPYEGLVYFRSDLISLLPYVLHWPPSPTST